MVKKPIPSCWNCTKVGQAVSMDRRDVVCRFYGELRVLGRVGDFIAVPDDCPKKGKEATK
ncbi:MAG: hypothetical protein WCO26_24120 [Deltaproteobacteria bacterium]